MLFALDWIQQRLQTASNAINSTIGSASITSITGFFTGSIWMLLLCTSLFFLLCFWGFRWHRLVSGIVGGALLSWLGVYLSRFTDSSQLSAAIIYALVMFILGFFILYVLYHINVFTGVFLLSYSLLSVFGLSRNYVGLLVSVAAAAVYVVLYVKYKLVLSAVTGAIGLGLIANAISPTAGIVVCCAATAAGIPLQILFRRLYYEHREMLSKQECEKYPYGPGLVYGWPEPKRK